MDGFSNQTHQDQQNVGGIADPSLGTTNSTSTATSSQGSSVLTSDLSKALDQTLAPDEKAAAPAAGAATLPVDDHNHAPTVGPFNLHVDLATIANATPLDPKKVGKQGSFEGTFGDKGDFLNPGGGNNTVIAGGGNDVIRGTGRGLNTITTGTGNDTIILGQETTNRILDFDPAHDHFDLQGLKPQDIVIVQGTNPGKGGLQQPLDSVNNTLIVDKTEGHILASLAVRQSLFFEREQFFKTHRRSQQKLE